MPNKLFSQHQEAQKKAERATADYANSLKDIGTKTSTDKGGRTEKMRDAHTKRQTK